MRDQAMTLPAARGTVKAAGAAAVLLLGAAMAVCPTGAAAQDASAAPAQAADAGAADAGQIRAVHLQGNIWLMAGEPGQSNVVVSVGNQGILVVDTGEEAMAKQLVAAIQQVADDYGPEQDGEPTEVRLIIDTDSRADHIGGNSVVAAAGRTVVAGNFARDAQSQGLDNAATVMANINVLNHLVADNATRPRDNPLLLPEAAVDADVYNTYFNGEAVQLFHPHAAATDDDTEVMFRRSDVIAAGDTVDMRGYPLVDVARGGTIDGELVALNKIIEMAVPADKQEGGTVVIPGHGRLCDQSDVVHYKNVITIIRDRVQFYKNQGKSLQQVLALRPSGDFDQRWGAGSGPSSAHDFVEAVYKTLPAKGPRFSMQNETIVGSGALPTGGKAF